MDKFGDPGPEQARGRRTTFRGAEESPDFTGQDARKGRREATESATENTPPAIGW